MKTEKLNDGRILMEFSIKEGDKLAEAIIKHATHMPNAALELSSLLREAKYQAGNTFRQPPRAWEPGARSPRSVSSGD